MSVETRVTADGGRLLVGLSGRLDLLDVAPLRHSLLKCIAEHPDALMLDLSELSVAEPLALSVFPSVARQAARWPAIPVVLCAPRPETRQALGLATNRQMALIDTVDIARSMLADDRTVLPTITDDLLPIRGAARQARNVATDACLRWELPHLVAPASLIASELASNGVDHAHTMMTLRMSIRGRYLHIAVRDGAVKPPELRATTTPAAADGRGLLLVEATAHSWGWLPCDGGKVVWASLAVR
ncbi:ATP-binding protein [Actinoplanes sp. NPDC051475]|uniref:ATP-binding protein n=1 Tax=Actinoplanes sp. NPDC051475 TaxID=3157225 RepID=UPI00344D5065